MKSTSQKNNIQDPLNEPLAIVGMNCQFPGIDSDVDDVHTLYEMLIKGISPIQDIPADRWDIQKYYDPDIEKADKIITRKGGFLKNIRDFDAYFFKLSSVEAKQMDPQHRLFLEVAIRALNHANIRLDSLSGSGTGVYCGISSQDYNQLNFKDNIQFNAYTQIGVAGSAAAGRLSHFLNLKGPSLAVDTACSSSMSALYLASTALRSQQCDMVIVGGVHLNLCPENFIGLSKAKMLSASGQCSSFDTQADGFVRSEGCAVIVVKRLSDAIKAQDKIHAVIKSIVMNHNGDGASLAAPNLKAQIAMHQSALAQAHIDACDIDYIEAHGTGTVVGDTIEWNAIQHLHQGQHSKDNPLIIGALKSNLGHTIAVSGMASLMKVIGALQHEQIAPNLHYANQSQSIDSESIPAILPIKPISFLQRRDKPRLIQISNSGFTGVNVSAIIEEAPEQAPHCLSFDNHMPQCFVLSAHSEASLKQLMVKYQRFLQDTSASLRDICITLIQCRDHDKFRCAVMALDLQTLRQKIASADYVVKKVTLQKTITKLAYDPNLIYEHYLSGVNICLASEDLLYNKIDLPLYCFDRQPYWHEPRAQRRHDTNSTLEHEPDEAIAIIGMSCRFPKARNVDAYLSLLKNGESGMTDIPLDRWDNAKYYDSNLDTPGRLYNKQMGLLDNIKNFDAEFFNISPREAKLMSPQLRILLETSYHALEDANLSLNSIKDSNTGVFIGCERNEYPEVIKREGLTLEDLDIYYATGNVQSALPGRVAYAFEFQGPLQTIDTACSSSMTAIHNACCALQTGDCDMALAGGVNMILSPLSNISLSKAKMLSPDSRCKTFSEDADGYARSEGCGMIVLKRLSRAIEDHDNILAVIKGSALNSDGKSEGFTVPDGNAQEVVIRRALAKANVTPGDIDYIEAHGTGTPTADPIEMNMLSRVFGEQHSQDKPLYVSSVKTNIGHCESASGVAGLIKAVLSLQTQTLFKHLNFKKLNPAIVLKNTVIPLSNMPWPKADDLRCVGINSFGFSGANAHVVLQQAPNKQKMVRTLPEESLLVISAKKKETLLLLLASYQRYLSNTNDAFVDICYTAATCRNHFLFRVAIKARTAVEAAAAIAREDYTIFNAKQGEYSHLPALSTLQKAYEDGCTVDWPNFYQSLNIPFEKVKLPLYEFDRTAYWFEQKHATHGVSTSSLMTAFDNDPEPQVLLQQDSARSFLAQNKLSSWLHDYLSISDDKQLNACKALLFEISQTIQELPKTDHLDEDAGFFDIGFDSLMLTEMALILQEKLEPTLKISIHIAFDYPSIHQLATYIQSELNKKHLHQALITEQSSSSEDTDIAIIGMSCSFPKASDLVAFQQLLEQGLNGMRDIPLDRWDNRQYYDANPDAPGKSYVNQLGLIDNIRDFDANFFGISQREAMCMEPQQRIFLECCYLSVENANYPIEKLRGSSTGVFAGVCTNEYYQQLEKSGFSNQELSMYSITGNVLNLIPGRVAYIFDLKGPSISIDTACSSSLVAIHYACQSLKNREIDFALAGGVNILLMPESNITLSKAKALAPDGQCKTFDERADGYARSEGCGVLMLKRVKDAIRDNDNILAIIKASAVNNDGKSAGLTVPNGKSQEDVMRMALAQTRLSPADIGYIEAHGTGTPLGDPIEVHAINRVYGNQRSVDNPLYIGTVKTNIGHLESASGVAGLMKTVMALQHHKIYKHLNFTQLNPHINIQDTRIALETLDWTQDSKPKCAAVNAFGFSGTNAHVILQSFHQKPSQRTIKPDKMALLVFSAKSKASLDQLANRYQAYLESTAHDFEDICYTAATCRSHYAYRLAIIAGNAASAGQMLGAGEFALSSGPNPPVSLQHEALFQPLMRDYLQGKSVDWSSYYHQEGKVYIKVALPHYVFDRKLFWPNIHKATKPHQDNIHPLLGQMLSMPNHEYLFYHTLDTEHLRALEQPVLFNHIIFSASAIIESALSAAKFIFNGDAFAIEKLNIAHFLFIKENQDIQFQAKPTEIDGYQALHYQINLFAKQNETWHQCSAMKVQAKPLSTPLSVNIEDLKSSPNGVLVQLTLSKGDHESGYYFHPTLLERALQSCLSLLPANQIYLPYALTAMSMFQSVPRNLWVYITKRDVARVNELCVDIQFYDNTGITLGNIEALAFKKVTRADRVSSDVTLQHLYLTQWHTLNTPIDPSNSLPELIVIAQDPLKAKMRLGDLPYQLISDLKQLDRIVDKNILFLYEEGQFMDLFHTCQRLFSSYPARFILVTEQAYAIAPDDVVNPYQTMASSFWKSFKNELANQHNYTIDVAPNSQLISALTVIFDENNTDNQFALRHHLYVPRLAKKALSHYSAKPGVVWNSQASYLIVGGTGALAKILIQYLIDRNVKHIVLVSRSECPDDIEHMIDSAAQQEVSIQHMVADASHAQQIKHVLDTLEQSPHRLKGVFHLAGIIQDGLIVNLSDESVQQVLAAKMESALILHQLTKKIPLDLFVMFSSAASLLGGRGQSNYAAANGFLDGLAHLRHQQGMCGVAINWGPFHSVGMAANLTVGMQEYGFMPLNPESIQILDILLEMSVAQIAPCPIDWDRYCKHALNQSWLSGLVKNMPIKDQRLISALKKHTRAERMNILRRVLCDMTTDVLAMDDLEKISAHDNLFSMGLDSLMSLEIRHRIHDKLQCDALSIPIEYFIHEPSIDKIAHYIEQVLQSFYDDSSVSNLPEYLENQTIAVSDFQYLFWAINQLEYSANVGMQLRLHGPLNKDFVFQAFDFIVRQHHVFWLSFNKNIPLQTMNNQGQFHLIYQDISSSEAINTLDEAFHINIGRVMPLTKQPLLRVYLYKINQELHELHLVIPHLIVDTASCAIVWEQFKTSYEALAHGNKLIPTPEKYSFLDYVQLHHQHYEKNLKNKIGFWKNYNKGFKNIYFGDGNHLADASVYQKQHLFHYTIPSQLMESFIDWLQSKNMNMSTGLIAACQIALYNISGQKKIPIMLIHSGREGSQYKSMVGLFAEYKRINLDYHEEDTLFDCIRAIEEELLKTADYQQCVLPIKTNGLSNVSFSAVQLLTWVRTKFLLTKWFKQSKLNLQIIKAHLGLLGQMDLNKKIFFIKNKLNHIFRINLALQKPNPLGVLISITPSFFVKETQTMRFANLDYTFASHFGCLDQPIGNEVLWIYFTKNQYGEYIVSINGSLTTACKDKIALNFNTIIAGAIGTHDNIALMSHDVLAEVDLMAE